MNFQTDEAGLRAVMKKATENLRMTILRDDSIHSLTREMFALLSPQVEEFKTGDQIVWMHKYSHKEYPPCRGVILYWSESKTRVRIKYANTLFDAPIGTEVEAWVYPRELVHRSDFRDSGDLIQLATVPAEGDGVPA